MRNPSNAPSTPCGGQSGSGGRRPACTLPLWRQLLAEADLCAQHADEAAQCGRFCAACGLILTADALCRRALGASAGGIDCHSEGKHLEVEWEVVARLGFYQGEVQRLEERASATRQEHS